MMEICYLRICPLALNATGGVRGGGRTGREGGEVERFVGWVGVPTGIYISEAF